MCCPGCRAVASLIADAGMDSFYQQRTAYSIRPEAAGSRGTAADREHFRVYDDPEMADTFTERLADGVSRSRLLLGGHDLRSLHLVN